MLVRPSPANAHSFFILLQSPSLFFLSRCSIGPRVSPSLFSSHRSSLSLSFPPNCRRRPSPSFSQPDPRSSLYLAHPLKSAADSLSLSAILPPRGRPPADYSFSSFWSFRLKSSFHNMLSSRNFSHGSVKLVIREGKPSFETQEIDPPKREKWKNKKRLKLQRKREKRKRKVANKKDPRRLTVKGKRKKQRFANVEERIKYKLEKAKIKERLLIERLEKLEVPRVQGPVVQPHELTGEERFYLKKMGQKGSNYVPVGRRGIFGGVILNMHMHWKKHETVKVFCKPCKSGQIHDYAQEMARLSGGIPIQIIGDDTIIFYRGKNYVQPEVMSPIDTLSKKRALEKSKYEQSLESVRHFIAVAEKELELYNRHIALYGNSNDHNINPTSGDLTNKCTNYGKRRMRASDDSLSCLSDAECSTTDQELSDSENELKGDNPSSQDTHSNHGDSEGCFTSTRECPINH